MKKTNIFIGIELGIIVIIGGWLIFSNRISQLISQGEIGIPSESIKQEVILGN